MDSNEKAKVIGNYLKKLRKDNHLTGAELGKNIDYTQSHISGIENGKKGIPTYKFLLSYFSGLGFTYNEFQNHLHKITELTGENFERKIQGLEHENAFNFNEFIERNKYRKIDYARGVMEEFDFPINDIKHNFKDLYNVKFWGDRQLSDDDMHELSDHIEMFFRHKDEGAFEALVSLYIEGLINDDMFRMNVITYAPSLLEKASKIIEEGD